MSVQRDPAPFVDGGAVLVARPYTPAQWNDVRRAWWWHTAGMLLVMPWYSLVALTVWQRPSGQPLLRRVFWSVVLTALSIAVIGLPLLIAFSRRWYWLWRTGVEPVIAGVPAHRPEPSAGIFPWVAATGAGLADRVASTLGSLETNGAERSTARRPVTLPADQARQRFDEPWASLVAEATQARDRIHTSALSVTGPAVEVVAAARQEADAGAMAAWQVADHAARIAATLDRLGTDRAKRRLTELEGHADPSADVEAAKRSLREQVATADRMDSTRRRLRDQLERLVAQLGEAAALTDELAVRLPGDEMPGLESAVDRLAAIRIALETVDATAPVE